MCSSNFGTGRSPVIRYSHPFLSHSLAITLVCRLDLSSVRATLKRDNPSHPGGNMLFWIIKCENGATSVCYRVPEEWSSRQATSIVDGWATCIATERLRELQKSISAKQAQDQERNQTLVHLVAFFFFTLLNSLAEGKTPPTFELLGCKKCVSNRRQATLLINVCPRAQSWAPFRCERFRSSQAFKTFYLCSKVVWIPLTPLKFSPYRTGEFSLCRNVYATEKKVDYSNPNRNFTFPLRTLQRTQDFERENPDKLRQPGSAIPYRTLAKDQAIWGGAVANSVTASDFGSNGPRFESGRRRGRCVESLDKALYSHCPKEKPSH